MNPLDSVVKFIEDSRAVGIPDRIIFEGLQVAMVEAAMMQMVDAESRAAVPVKAKASHRVVGFTS
jgi:hypothetical protein